LKFNKRLGARRISDVALHRATRAAVVNPTVFAVTLLVVHNLQVATFAVFGCFGLLVMADFGGSRRPRAVAYAATALGGAVLIALGTAVSASAAAAAIVMLGVGFVLAFAGVFGGYVASAQTALLLAFVLAASIPASFSSIPTRLAGWMIAGAISTVAGVFFWPRFEHASLRNQVADACGALADLVATMRLTPGGDAVAAGAETARDAVSAIQHAYRQTGLRPSGPARRDRALVELVAQLQQVIELAERPFHADVPSLRPCIREGDELANAVVETLRQDGSVLTGGTRPAIRDLVRVRRTHRDALDQWAVQELRAGRPAAAVLDGLDVDHTLRVVAYLTIALSTNAVIAAGVTPDDDFSLPAGIPRAAGARGVALRIGRTVRTHLEPSSTVLHGSARMAIGLAISVLLARTLSLEHAFWVVLGTLSVLRSNALGTGRTAVQALAGSVIGFVLGGVFIGLAGTHTVAMWIAMPIATFLASYAASAIGFVAGQAAFTVMVIIIFNLISPAGWQLGLVRLEDIAVGTGISVVIGLLLWPRGARRDLARAMAGFFQAVRTDLREAFNVLLGGDSDPDIGEIRAEAERARDRATEAFDVFLNERGSKPLRPDAAAQLVSAGSQGMLAADSLVAVAEDYGYRADACPDGAAAVDAEVRRLLAGFDAIANRLAGSSDGGGSNPGQLSAMALRRAAVGCLERSGGDEAATRAAMAVVIAGEWVQNLARMEADLEQPVATAVAAARVAWWH